MSSKTRATVRPHFMVRTDTYTAARTRAAEHGITPSDVVRAGFARYVTQRVDVPPTDPFPAEVRDRLTELAASPDLSGELDLYVAAMRKAGLSLADAAAHLGVSRQRLHQRANRVGPRVRLPRVPKGAPRTDPRRPALTGDDRDDRSFHIPKDLYDQARETAKAHGERLSDVAETALRDYTRGRLRVPPRT